VYRIADEHHAVSVPMSHRRHDVQGTGDFQLLRGGGPGQLAPRGVLGISIAQELEPVFDRTSARVGER